MPVHDRLDRRIGIAAPIGRLGFILSLWMSLATAVICAIVPAGLPASRSIGSAFDPSTTIVALRSRPPVAKPALLRDDDGDAGVDLDKPAGILLHADAKPALVTTFTMVAPALAFAEALSFQALRLLDVTLYARPPPAA